MTQVQEAHDEMNGTMSSKTMSKTITVHSKQRTHNSETRSTTNMQRTHHEDTIHVQ